MSMHKIPLTPIEEAGLHAHGLQRHIGKPSQLADVFRQGVAWGQTAERERLLEGIDECPGITMEQDRWLSDMVRSNMELRGAEQASPAERPSPTRVGPHR